MVVNLVVFGILVDEVTFGVLGVSSFQVRLVVLESVSRILPRELSCVSIDVLLTEPRPLSCGLPAKLSLIPDQEFLLVPLKHFVTILVVDGSELLNETLFVVLKVVVRNRAEHCSVLFNVLLA